jgi:hypothetical protein
MAAAENEAHFLFNSAIAIDGNGGGIRHSGHRLEVPTGGLLTTGHGVTFFGIGPIGATILAVELLKLPLAIWTASRQGWAKTFMLFAGLPMVCVLTFQLVKDRAVYEMGTAMTPATQFLEKATAEEVKMNALKGELASVETNAENASARSPRSRQTGQGQSRP